jgi:hypothetical protein
MAKKVFFSFHYGRDAVRAGQVRNSNVIQNRNIETSDFIDKAAWEQVKKGGETEIKRWINDQLNGTSVTVVLIGAETASRDWVKYEIDQSIAKKNGLVGVYIHKCPLFDGSVDGKGVNPFEELYLSHTDGSKKYLSELYKTYDWVNDSGRENLGSWIEEAAGNANR